MSYSLLSYLGMMRRTLLLISLILRDYYGISPKWLLQIAEEADSGVISMEEFMNKAQSVMSKA
jgi:hypothetical protein